MPDSSFASPLSAKRMVSELSLGAEVADIFVLASAQQGQARNGPYWRLDFCDASGNISGKIWSPQSQNYAELAAGMMVQVKGRVVTYRDKLELAVESLRVLDEEECARQDLALFMPASAHNPEQMMEELLALTDKTLLHAPWRALITALLTDAEIGPALRLAPAAKAMHHAYAGGLLEHTLSVARLCLRLADQYPGLDRQTLFAGAVCHDLGKLWELSPGFAVDYTQAGKLLGHIALFLDRLAPFIKESRLEPELAEHLQHLILSHHGSYEFGSSRLPSTPEALVLHYADILDAKLNQVENALAGLEEQSWSPYIPALERSLFCAKPTPSAQTLPEPPEEESRAPAPEAASIPKATEANHPEPPLPSPPEPFSRDASFAKAPGKNAPNPPAPRAINPGSELPLFSQCSSASKE